jgi:hypothetical protein
VRLRCRPQHEGKLISDDEQDAKLIWDAESTISLWMSCFYLTSLNLSMMNSVMQEQQDRRFRRRGTNESKIDCGQANQIHALTQISIYHHHFKKKIGFSSMFAIFFQLYLYKLYKKNFPFTVRVF